MGQAGELAVYTEGQGSIDAAALARVLAWTGAASYVYVGRTQCEEAGWRAHGEQSVRGVRPGQYRPASSQWEALPIPSSVLSACDLVHPRRAIKLFLGPNPLCQSFRKCIVEDVSKAARGPQFNYVDLYLTWGWHDLHDLSNGRFVARASASMLFYGNGMPSHTQAFSDAVLGSKCLRHIKDRFSELAGPADVFVTWSY